MAIFLTPVDTFKTTLQVQGNAAFNMLKDKVKAGGVGVLYNGAAANFAASLVGNYPWFATFNYLQKNIPQQDTALKQNARNAAIGMCASIVSDCISNLVARRQDGEANVRRRQFGIHRRRQGRPREGRHEGLVRPRFVHSPPPTCCKRWCSPSRGRASRRSSTSAPRRRTRPKRAKRRPSRRRKSPVSVCPRSPWRERHA